MAIREITIGRSYLEIRYTHGNAHAFPGRLALASIASCRLIQWRCFRPCGCLALRIKPLARDILVSVERSVFLPLLDNIVPVEKREVLVG